MGNLWVPRFDSSSSSSSSTRSSSTATDNNHSSSALERPPWHHRFNLAWFVRERKRRQDLLASSKFTPFQRLDFTEADIVRGLVKSNLIGSGFSKAVYQISVGNRAGEVVAVKKIWHSKSLDAKLEREFQAKIEILGAIRHPNIIKLMCCISGEDSTLLVYEYMENGSLDRWLCKKRNGATFQSGLLDWPSRYRIAVGVAQGLCYMHHDCSPPIIQRCMKSSNILLDSEFKARITDCDLGWRMLALGREPEFVRAGSYFAPEFVPPGSYYAPEYAFTGRPSEKSDVYSFGVVLLELATGRPAYSTCDGYGSVKAWALHHWKEGKEFDEALDEDVRKPACLNEMRVVLKLGLICTGNFASTRPSMKDVLQVLLKCRPSQNFGSKKASSEYDVAPLRASSSLFGNTGGGNKISSLEEEVGSLV